MADQVRMEVAEILLRKIKDPRVKFVTVTDVRMTADLKIARIYVSTLAPEQYDRETAPGLKSAIGFIRTEIGRRLNLRYTPEIQFYQDTSAEYANRMEKILDSLPQEDSHRSDESSSSLPST